MKKRIFDSTSKAGRLNGISLKKWPERLRHKRYTQVKCVAADGTVKMYLVRKVEGYITGYQEKVCVVISKRHNRDKHPKYFLCTDTRLSAQAILNWYNKRWSIEKNQSYCTYTAKDFPYHHCLNFPCVSSFICCWSCSLSRSSASVYDAHAKRSEAA
ncbi:hypothetical protein ES703_106706 [subsurface metagenome]